MLDRKEIIEALDNIENSKSEIDILNDTIDIQIEERELCRDELLDAEGVLITYDLYEEYIDTDFRVFRTRIESRIEEEE